MRGIRLGLLALAAIGATALNAAAQQTAGNVNGRVLDQQQAAMPGVTVTGTNTATGYNRAATTDAEGAYHLTALPVGTYQLKVELSGFQSLTREILVEVGANIDVNFELQVQSLSESVEVTAESPLIETSTSSVGGVVDTKRIESMPLNGRQFANLAVTIPGVTLGMHSDPTKSTQFAPQIGGGNGRNINYQIDGGDNNDDTVGGLLQLFPLEAIDQFNVITSRYKAEYGRSNGGVMNIVTKSGTNQNTGSWFTLFRDDSLNAQTETEKVNDVEKQGYRRWQYGGSFGGPIVKNKIHYFGAFERTQQDTFQSVNTQGLFPNEDGIFALPYRETLVTVKGTATFNADNYLSVRYGRNENSQPYAVDPLTPPSGWGDSSNTFNSINANYNMVLGSAKLNEFIFQYADFKNGILPLSTDLRQTFPNGVGIGQNRTRRRRRSSRSGSSATTSRGTSRARAASAMASRWAPAGSTSRGCSSRSPRPRASPQFTHLDDTLDGPIATVTLNDGFADADIPMEQYAFYVQDDWKLTSRLTLNIGLRYDYIDGYQIDQSTNPNYVKVQQAGAAGQLAGIKGLENFGKTPKEDSDNWQPRIGAAFDLRGDGKDVIRGGWGIYQDVGYTNSNVLFPAHRRQRRVRRGVPGRRPGRHPQSGRFVLQGQRSAPQHRRSEPGRSERPAALRAVPRPAARDAVYAPGVDWLVARAHAELGGDGRLRQQPGTRPQHAAATERPDRPGRPVRRLEFLGLQPNALGTRAASSFAKSDYQAMIVGYKRRMSKGFDLTGSYTLAKGHSTVGTAVDELNVNNLQDATLLYDDPRVDGPTSRTDARHSGSIASIFAVEVGLPASRPSSSSAARCRCRSPKASI